MISVNIIYSSPLDVERYGIKNNLKYSDFIINSPINLIILPNR